jgi:hypothetical protein
MTVTEPLCDVAAEHGVSLSPPPPLPPSFFSLSPLRGQEIISTCNSKICESPLEPIIPNLMEYFFRGKALRVQKRVKRFARLGVFRCNG